jgi:hypothetical protein
VSALLGKPRPITALADLFANVWQLGYVTTDLDRGIELLRDGFGVDNLTAVPSGGADFYAGDKLVPWEAKFAMGARGGLIVELIEPVDGEVGFYRRALPDDGSFAVRLHHIATYAELGDEAWEAIAGLLAAHDLRFDYTMLIEGRVRAGYVDTTAELGHFLEVCQLQPADSDFFNSLAAA